MQLLNLGCGNSYHSDWINIDFSSYSPNVIQHDLLKGIPYPSNYFDFVYHSHVLEHFAKNQGEDFIKECYRVLKPNGIIRVVVPDLEQIVKEYLKNLAELTSSKITNDTRYEWNVLEMYDQTVRNFSGGHIKPFLQNLNEEDEKYIAERWGHELTDLKKTENPLHITPKKKSFREKLRILRYENIPKLRKRIAYQFARIILNDKNFRENYSIGKFRRGGEIHQWMYDRYSLSKLLSNSGFSNISIQQANTSKIKNWGSYNLDTQKDGRIRKPDSLFMEAIK